MNKLLFFSIISANEWFPAKLAKNFLSVDLDPYFPVTDGRVSTDNH